MSGFVFTEYFYGTREDAFIKGSMANTDILMLDTEYIWVNYLLQTDFICLLFWLLKAPLALLGEPVLISMNLISFNVVPISSVDTQQGEGYFWRS